MLSFYSMIFLFPPYALVRIKVKAKDEFKRKNWYYSGYDEA